MERIEIIVRPPSDYEGRLRVADAMQQVLDAVRLLDEAKRAIAAPEVAFEWRLERASTNSPLTVVAVAEPVATGVDVSSQVRRVTGEFSSGLRRLVESREIAWWMTPSALDIAKELFGRTQRGIAGVDIVLAANDSIVIGAKESRDGLAAIAAIDPLQLDAELPERLAFGELRGAMVSVGRFRNKPAIQIWSEQYGFIWCQLAPELMTRFGGEHHIAEVWDKKTLNVEGRLVYAKGGKLTKIEATNVRERDDAGLIDLDTVLDPNFTAGLDPAEYLRQLHEGELA